MFTAIFISGFFIACWIVSGFTYKTRVKKIVVTKNTTFED